MNRSKRSAIPMRHGQCSQSRPEIFLGSCCVWVFNLASIDFIAKAQRREDSKGPSSLGAFETLSLDSSPQIMLELSQVRRPGLPELSNLVSPEAGGLPGSELL